MKLENSTVIDTPSAYVDGYARAAKIDKELADIYVRHTGIGDPMADAAVKDLAALPRPQSARFIKRFGLFDAQSQAFSF